MSYGDDAQRTALTVHWRAGLDVSDARDPKFPDTRDSIPRLDPDTRYRDRCPKNPRLFSSRDSIPRLSCITTGRHDADPDYANYAVFERRHDALRWADEKCHQNGKECSAANRRAMLGTALFKIRLPLIPQKDFTEKIVPSGVLEKDEQAGVYQYYSHPDAGLPELSQLQFPTNGRVLTGLTPHNQWDSAACHKNLTLIEPDQLIVQSSEGYSELRSVFAEWPIPKGNSGTFYYEVTIFEQKRGIHIGLATKQMPLHKIVGYYKGTYAYAYCGRFLGHKVAGCSLSSGHPYIGGKPEFEGGDVIGCGVNLATGQIIYTKNGRRLETDGLHVDFGADLFPCISLINHANKIEANFGPNFKFTLPKEPIN
uniref:B30.2/SPRY domain-containing protein n=1 Tax=Globodera pallida TaxID=36090 RepID=A0A183BR87_GLOPA